MFNKRQREFRKQIMKGEKEFAKNNPEGYISHIKGDYVKPNKKQYKSDNGSNIFILFIIAFICYCGYKHYFVSPKQIVNINQFTYLTVSRQEQISNVLEEIQKERIEMVNTINNITSSYEGSSISHEYAEKLKDKTFTPMTCPENLTGLSELIDSFNSEVSITNEIIKIRNSNSENTNEQRLQINSLIHQYDGYCRSNDMLLIHIFEKENMKYEIQKDGRIRYWYNRN